MSKEGKLDLPDESIFGGPLSKLPPVANRLRNKRVIKKDKVKEIKTVMTIGGNCKDDNSPAPSIILERDGDCIKRIIVKCCCGRHAELECEEEEQNENRPN